VESAEPLGTAQSRAVSRESIEGQFGRLGNTAYRLRRLDALIEGKPFVPASLLNRLRREAVEKLRALQQARPEVTVHDSDAILQEELEQAIGRREAVPEQEARLHVLVRTPEQLEAALPLRPASITLDYLDLYGLRPSVERIQGQGIAARVASPRVLKPAEERIVHFLRKLNCAVLVRSPGLLEAFQQGERPPLTGDFSLNAANALTAAMLLRLGVEKITPTHDLNADQIATLAQTIGPEKVEVVAYQHLAIFHTEHCVFCRFLSQGTSHKDCGHPCEKHRIALRDVNGRAHPVMADVGCRNTVFGAEAQEASQYLELWRRTGIRDFRVEFAHETPEQVEAVCEAFAETLAGRRTAQWLVAQCRKATPGGATLGSLFVPANYPSLPVLQ